MSAVIELKFIPSPIPLTNPEVRPAPDQETATRTLERSIGDRWPRAQIAPRRWAATLRYPLTTAYKAQYRRLWFGILDPTHDLLHPTKAMPPAARSNGWRSRPIQPDARATAAAGTTPYPWHLPRRRRGAGSRPQCHHLSGFSAVAVPHPLRQVRSPGRTPK